MSHFTIYNAFRATKAWELPIGNYTAFLVVPLPTALAGNRNQNTCVGLELAGICVDSILFPFPFPPRVGKDFFD